VVFPVQYIDNGMLNEIPRKTSNITQVLQGQDYDGPIPHNSGDVGASLEQLNRIPPLNINTNVIPEFESDNEVIPYNSIDNVIASSQDIQEYESENM
jgi:hypothetical protein